MTTSFIPQIADIPHDKRDPHPFLAMWLDRSVPIDDEAKAAVHEQLRAVRANDTGSLLAPVLQGVQPEVRVV